MTHLTLVARVNQYKGDWHYLDDNAGAGGPLWDVPEPPLEPGLWVFVHDDVEVLTSGGWWRRPLPEDAWGDRWRHA